MAEMWINLGPQHPMTHGLWDLRVKVDGETIVDAEPRIGYLHRGIEKMGEHRTYVQFIPITDRLCYASSLSWSYSYVMTIEELMDVHPPERAEYIRVIMLELQRIASHLTWLAAYAADLGQLTMFLYPLRERELFLDLMQMVTGTRLTYNYPRIGGVRNDLPADFPKQTLKVLTWFEKKLNDYENMMDENEVFRMRNIGVGILRGEDAINLGITGPTLRGSNVKVDLRKDDPYSIYERFDFNVCVEPDGDCYARYKVRMGEMRESMKIIRRGLKELPKGEIMAERVPKAAPQKSVYGRTEDPRGEAGMYVVGDGTNKPYRIKIRSPAFVNTSALPHMLKGYKIADVPAICGSIDVCIGETDR